jgi:hypothetical protein
LSFTRFFTYRDTSLTYSLFDRPSTALSQSFIEGTVESGYLLELVGTRRAYALAVAGATEALALLFARGEWTCPQIDELLLEHGPAFQRQMARKMQSKRFSLCVNDGQRQKAIDEFASEISSGISQFIPREILAARPLQPEWLSQIFVEAPTAFVIDRIVRLTNTGPHFVGISPSRSDVPEPRELRDSLSTYQWLWAMGWVLNGHEVEAVTFLQTLTMETLKKQCYERGWKSSGTKEQLVQRVLERLSPQGVCTSSVFAEYWPKIYQLSPTVIADPLALSSAWKWYLAYAAFFVEKLSQKKSQINGSLIRAFGFLKLNTERCTDQCHRPTFAGDYDPKLHRVPPYNIICGCYVEKDYSRLESAMHAENERRRAEWGVLVHTELLKTDIGNLANDLSDAFGRIENAKKVDCLIDEILNDDEEEPMGYSLAASLSRLDAGDIELEVFSSVGAKEGEHGVSQTLLTAGWRRLHEQEDCAGGICWKTVLDPELCLRAAVAEAARCAVEKLAFISNFLFQQKENLEIQMQEKLDRLWMLVEVNSSATGAPLLVRKTGAIESDEPI